MKKLMRSLLITGICASIMTSGFAFADSENGNQAGGRFGQAPEGRPSQERMTEEERTEKQEQRQENREERQAHQEEKEVKLLEVVNEFAPSMSEDFEDAFNEADSLHSELSDIKKENKPSDEDREAMKSTFEAIREKVKNGEMTREEAKEELYSLRPERPDHDSEKPSDEDRDAKRAENEVKREAFQTALEDGDTETIIDYLEEILEHIQERNVALAEKITEL